MFEMGGGEGGGGTHFLAKELERLELCSEFSVFLDILFRSESTLKSTGPAQGRMLDLLFMAAPGEGFLTLTRRVCAGRG